MPEKDTNFAFDLNDELAQLSDLTNTLVSTLSQQVLDYEKHLEGAHDDSSDKLKNKLRAFRFDTVEAMTEMIRQIKNKGLSMTPDRRQRER